MAVTIITAIGCGDSQSPTTSSPVPPGQAVISVLVSPANSTPSGDSQFPWAASFTVTVAETAGVALQLMEITIQLDQPVIFDGTFLGTGRVAGGGSVSVPLSLGLTQNGLVADVVVKGTDENGNPVQATGRLFVIAAQGP